MTAERADAPRCRTVLNVGCGPSAPARVHTLFPAPAWREVRMDLDRRVAPDIVGSITDLSMLPDASVDAVWSSHMLEHLHRHEVGPALREVWRVLVPGGALVAVVPDLQRVCRYVAEDRLDEVLYTAPAGAVTACDIIFGFGEAIAAGNPFMAHRTGFTPSVLLRDLQGAGFDPILLRRREVLELEAIAHRPFPDGRPIPEILFQAPAPR
ncbi:class I SAM-dependent methyltransferase [Azospirillum sp. ST 5-10]|uniref:class I SAM-dependent methyltransferase n=1 Tax=unclassified Azospirillum TaxID=2630922 RepID=UPI003F49F7B7